METVSWMNAHMYEVKIQCLRSDPFTDRAWRHKK